MSINRSNRPPSPNGVRNWHDWASQLTEYLNRSGGTKASVEPQMLMLVSKTISPNVMEDKATDNGLLMYNPAIGLPEFSKDGAWYPILSQNAVQDNSIQTGSANVVEEATIVFPTPYAAAPNISVTAKATLADNEAITSHVTAISATQFTVQLRMIDTAFSTFVRPTTADIDWTAIGSLT